MIILCFLWICFTFFHIDLRWRGDVETTAVQSDSRVLMKAYSAVIIEIHKEWREKKEKEKINENEDWKNVGIPSYNISPFDPYLC